MKLRINNKDLPYTIDTYGMFTGDSTEESERDHYTSELGISENAIEFEYDHKGIVQALASESVNLLEQNLVQHNETDGIVRSISEPIETRSPQFYNYTTDSYVAEWDVDAFKLLKVVENHKNAAGETFKQWLVGSGWDVEPMTEDYVVAMLDYWLPSIYEADDYNMSMWEAESEAYYENMKPTPEFQAILDKEAQNA